MCSDPRRRRRKIEKDMTKQAGKRKMPGISLHASGELLARGCAFNDAIHLLPTGETTFFPRGVYRYKSHEEANRHFEQCVIEGMARLHRD